MTPTWAHYLLCNLPPRCPNEHVSCSVSFFSSNLKLCGIHETQCSFGELCLIRDSNLGALCDMSNFPPSYVVLMQPSFHSFRFPRSVTPTWPRYLLCNLPPRCLNEHVSCSVSFFSSNPKLCGIHETQCSFGEPCLIRDSNLGALCDMSNFPPSYVVLMQPSFHSFRFPRSVTPIWARYLLCNLPPRCSMNMFLAAFHFFLQPKPMWYS